jgi:hypothetical protein
VSSPIIAPIRPELAPSLIITWRQAAVQYPFLYHAQAVYSATVALIAIGLRENTLARSLRRIQLEEYNLALQAMSREISHPNFKPTDAHIHAVAILIWVEPREAVDMQEVPSKSVVCSLQSFNYVGEMDLINSHVKGFYDLVDLKGGIATVRSYNLEHLMEV